jgi:hypothetical protein
MWSGSFSLTCHDVRGATVGLQHRDRHSKQPSNRSASRPAIA